MRKIYLLFLGYPFVALAQSTSSSFCSGGISDGSASFVVGRIYVEPQILVEKPDRVPFFYAQ